MSKRSGLYRRVRLAGGGTNVVSHAGAALLTRTIGASGLDRELSAALKPWRKPTATHDPGKVLLDLALALALGGDCLADIALARSEPEVFGLVASDPTVSRTIDALAADAGAALAAINGARAVARGQAWALAGDASPAARMSHRSPLIVDMDATLVTAHSDKDGAAPTWKRGYGHHPLWAFLDHGEDGTGEPLAVMLRKGNAGSNTAADHVQVLADALAQLPIHPAGRVPRRVGRRVLVRIDGAGASHEVLTELHRRRLAYSVGFTLPENTPELLQKIPKEAWQQAYNCDGKPRKGAWVAELTGLLHLDPNDPLNPATLKQNNAAGRRAARKKKNSTTTCPTTTTTPSAPTSQDTALQVSADQDEKTATPKGWPPGMRVIVRKERPHPGAQLRITDVDGHRVTAFVTNTAAGGTGTQLADLELRHRRRARAEDRIRVAKDTGLANLPLKEMNQNAIWLAVVSMACEITAWMQMLAFTGHAARRWEPKRLRYRLFSIAAQAVTTARVRTLRLADHCPWTKTVLDGLDRLTRLTTAPSG